MLSNQVEGKIIEHAHEWDDHTIVTWDYGGANVIYFLGQEEGQYDVDFLFITRRLILQGHTIDILCQN
jgi:hypothetical protein